RDRNVTGVQTCALPILLAARVARGEPAAQRIAAGALRPVGPGERLAGTRVRRARHGTVTAWAHSISLAAGGRSQYATPIVLDSEIGRASCRDRGEVAGL